MCNMCIKDKNLQAPAPPPAPSKVFGNLELMKKHHNLITDPFSPEKQKEVEYQPDLLAVSIQFSKGFHDNFKRKLEQVKESKAYLIATRTSQPLHIALAMVVLAVWATRPGTASSLRGWRALYVMTVATHLGAQIWMTLVSGIVLYFNLPRHDFGHVQTVLFPVYYAFNALMSLLAFLAYFRAQFLTQFENTSWIQLALLLAVFSIEAYVRMRLVRPMLQSKHIKTQMEKAAGGGQEIGKLVLGELAHCPRYLRVLRTFRMYHSKITMGTMISLGCSVYSTMIIVDSMCN